MSILEKEFADIIIYSETQEACGVSDIDVAVHLEMAHAWLKREQGLREHVHSYVPREAS